MPAEAIATVTVRCERCAWDIEGREAVVLALKLDDGYVAAPAARPRRPRRVSRAPRHRRTRARITVALGRRSPTRQRATCAAERRPPCEVVRIEQIDESRPPLRGACALAPFVYARPDTVGRFTDVPVFMWYEVEPTARGTRYRYSVIFTNEDGGTPADRLMATWGRTTDIEYVYSVEVDGRRRHHRRGHAGAEARDPAVPRPARGQHPLLWVSTDNNMVLDRGTTEVRYAPAPVHVHRCRTSRAKR